MPDQPARPNSNENDAEKLARLLELELMQKRTAWKQGAARYRSMRLFGLFFLFIFILACAGGFLFVFSRVNEKRTNQHDASTAAAAGP